MHLSNETKNRKSHQRALVGMDTGYCSHGDLFMFEGMSVGCEL